MVKEKLCSIEGCGRKVLARDWCHYHYHRWWNTGDPIAKKLRASPGDPMRWLRAHVDWKDSECLIWPFSRGRHGYPTMNGRSPIRIMCELVHGNAPHPSNRYETAHSCGKGKSGCINPIHLRYADKVKHGTDNLGEKNPQARLKREDIIVIRSLRNLLSRAKIAKRFGVSSGCIEGVLSGRTWAHV
jgi:hypothetical protein